ncbi:barstar family protein [Streptomyces sp. NBC_00638]|uniref:barstar family protein n=1 Tax=Streptomyces sp. NBC_00638 TaxID=2975794 RepID=UPI0022518D9A|nr:barstar family protein [Streptomyces sp. NBC_00638]MCX5009224.1 barstar family protein [Streptomyces sp. NBC_00638]
MPDVAVRAGCKFSGEEEGGKEDFWGAACDISGLFDSLGGGLRRVKLSGLTPKGRLLDRASRFDPGHARVGNADLTLLDVNGVEVGSYFVADIKIEEIASSSPSADVFDTVITLDCENLLPDSEWTWNQIRSGKLNRTGMWHSLDSKGRHAWLSVALNHHGYREINTPRPGTAYELDGRYILDESSFYCAFGEAINGPAGYFGWNLSALDDCLSGDWGASRPMVLNWNHSQASRERIMGDDHTAREYEGQFLNFLTEILSQRNVTVNYL